MVCHLSTKFKILHLAQGNLIALMSIKHNLFKAGLWEMTMTHAQKRRLERAHDEISRLLGWDSDPRETLLERTNPTPKTPLFKPQAG